MGSMTTTKFFYGIELVGVDSEQAENFEEILPTWAGLQFAGDAVGGDVVIYACINNTCKYADPFNAPCVDVGPMEMAKKWNEDLVREIRGFFSKEEADKIIEKGTGYKVVSYYG